MKQNKVTLLLALLNLANAPLSFTMEERIDGGDTGVTPEPGAARPSEGGLTDEEREATTQRAANEQTQRTTNARESVAARLIQHQKDNPITRSFAGEIIDRTTEMNRRIARGETIEPKPISTPLSDDELAVVNEQLTTKKTELEKLQYTFPKTNKITTQINTLEEDIQHLTEMKDENLAWTERIAEMNEDPRTNEPVQPTNAARAKVVSNVTATITSIENQISHLTSLDVKDSTYSKIVTLRTSIGSFKTALNNPETSLEQIQSTYLQILTDANDALRSTLYELDTDEPQLESLKSKITNAIGEVSSISYIAAKAKDILAFLADNPKAVGIISLVVSLILVVTLTPKKQK